MNICFLSGKGGAGKTTLAASFIHVLQKNGFKTTVADCDVECPNLHLLMHPKSSEYFDVFAGFKAKINQEKCKRCGKCLSVCMFNAVDFDDGRYKVNRYCEGCFACSLVCPNNAIEKEKVKNGRVYISNNCDFCDHLVWGELFPGESASGKLVVEVKKKAFELKDNNSDLVVIDASAGIGCPVIASLKGCDFCFIVAEATPSGFSDFLKALSLTEALNIPSKIVVNKADVSREIKEKITKIVEKRGLDVVGFLPFIYETTKYVSELTIPSTRIKDYENLAEKMLESIKDFL